MDGFVGGREGRSEGKREGGTMGGWVGVSQAEVLPGRSSKAQRWRLLTHPEGGVVGHHFLLFGLPQFSYRYRWRQ